MGTLDADSYVPVGIDAPQIRPDDVTLALAELIDSEHFVQGVAVVPARPHGITGSVCAPFSNTWSKASTGSSPRALLTTWAMGYLRSLLAPAIQRSGAHRCGPRAAYQAFCRVRGALSAVEALSAPPHTL